MIYDVTFKSEAFNVQATVKRVTADSLATAKDLAMGILHTSILPRNVSLIDSTIYTSLCPSLLLMGGLTLNCKLECRHVGTHKGEYNNNTILWSEKPITSEPCSA